MAKWQGTVVPNTGYVEKVYFNTNLSVDEVVSLLSKLETNENDAGFILVSEDSSKLIGFMYIEGTYAIFNPLNEEFYFISDDLDWGFVGWNTTISYPLIINNNVVNSFQMEGNNFVSGTQNNLLTELFSTTPFTQSQPTTADKLQKLIDGKQYVIDKTNAKAETNLQLNCTWEQLGDTIEGIQGSGGIVIPSVSNLVVNEDGVASWDKPDFSNLEELDYTYSYIVSVNGKETETINNNLNVMASLVEGANVVSVVVKVIVTTIKNGKEINETIEFSMPSYTLVTLEATLPTVKEKLVSAVIGTNVYLFGGVDNTGAHTTTIYKFDSLTETITTLDTTLPTANSGMASAVIGTNVYLIGGSSSKNIYKFDTKTETITTLDTMLDVYISYKASAVIGTNVYLFGVGSYTTTIYKFDTKTETITTLDTTLPTATSNNASATIGTNVYIFGGQTSSSGSSKTTTIYKFDSLTETITTLDTTLPTANSGMASATIGTNVYIFGGENTSNLKQNKIYKFDTKTETITTLDTTLPTANSGMASATIGTNVYIFGGNSSTGRTNTIVKFIE